MGNADLGVLFGFLLTIGATLSVVVLVFRGIESKWIAAAIAFVLIAVASPFWLVLGNKAFFSLACHFGGPGPEIVEAFRIDTVTRRGNDRSRDPPRWNPEPHRVGDRWEPGPEFVDDCRNGRNAEQCREILNSVEMFDWAAGWRIIRDNGIAVEQAWMVGPQDKQALRHARLRVAPTGSADCLIPLYEVQESLKGTRCIAGHAIPASAAKFVLLDQPYMQLFHPLERERPTSMEWRRFGVEKHQHQLLADGKVVARYVWYWRNMTPNSMFETFETCPEDARGALPSGSGVSRFWSAVLAR